MRPHGQTFIHPSHHTHGTRLEERLDEPRSRHCAWANRPPACLPAWRSGCLHASTLHPQLVLTCSSSASCSADAPSPPPPPCIHARVGHPRNRTHATTAAGHASPIPNAQPNYLVTNTFPVPPPSLACSTYCTVQPCARRTKQKELNCSMQLPAAAVAAKPQPLTSFSPPPCPSPPLLVRCLGSGQDARLALPRLASRGAQIVVAVFGMCHASNGRPSLHRQSCEHGAQPVSQSVMRRWSCPVSRPVSPVPSWPCEKPRPFGASQRHETRSTAAGNHW